jgi:hypothetical protein
MYGERPRDIGAGLVDLQQEQLVLAYHNHRSARTASHGNPVYRLNLLAGR